jgi:hypothetical protein
MGRVKIDILCAGIDTGSAPGTLGGVYDRWHNILLHSVLSVSLSPFQHRFAVQPGNEDPFAIEHRVGKRIISTNM